jgi:Fic family protein
MNKLTTKNLQSIETTKVLKKSIQANRALAKLNGTAKIIPNQNILINSLVLQEAKDSSEIENIITTHDELLRAGLAISTVTNVLCPPFVKRELPKIYSKDLLEILFMHPYTKIEFLVNGLGITRQTASKYLMRLEEIGILNNTQIQNSKFYINNQLFDRLKKGI